MVWMKSGLIFSPPEHHEWIMSHASIPTVDRHEDNVLRIYFGPRDAQGRTLTTFIDVDPRDPSNIFHFHDTPILSLGKPGTFDDNGVMPSCVLNYNGKKFFFYIGWNLGVTVPYRLAIGLAVSEDNGLTFKRVHDGPILDRNPDDPYFTTTPFVIIENGIWRMWYTSATNWITVQNRLEAVYTIKYAESSDGIDWRRNNITCMPYKFDGECLARPTVIKEAHLYKMWYSYRGSVNFRTNKEASYRIGYAESNDGISWTRKDSEVGIDISDGEWDSEMLAYSYVYQEYDFLQMLYCGNGFGKSGFGYAVRK